MKRKDLLINQSATPPILSRTLEFLKKIKTDDQVLENMEVYDDNSEQVLIEMDLHLGVFDILQSKDGEGASNSLHSHSDNSFISRNSDDFDGSDSSLHSDDSSGNEDGSSEEEGKVQLIEEVE